MLLAGEIFDGATIAITSGTDRLQFRVKGSKPRPLDGTFEVPSDNGDVVDGDTDAEVDQNDQNAA